MPPRKPITDKTARVRESLPKAIPIPSASDIIDTAFNEEATVRLKYSEHLTPRIKKDVDSASAAKMAFTGFAPSRFTKGEREPRRYLKPGENLAATMERLIKDGAERIRTDKAQRTLKLVLTDEVQKLITTPPDGKGKQTVELPKIFEVINTKFAGSLSRGNEPVMTACIAEMKVQERLDSIEGIKKTDDTPETKDRVKSKTDDASETKDEQTNLTSNEKESASTKDFIAKQVHGLLSHVPSPEEKPVFVAPIAADRGELRERIEKFELRAGPSDVTSYHDFSSLQIAFEHVWTEVFDERIDQVGKEVYQAYIDLRDFVGSPIDPVTMLPIQPPATVTSIEDIKYLMKEASMLGQVTNNATPVSALPQGFADALAQFRQAFINQLVIHNVPVVLATDIVDHELAPLKSQINLANTQSGNSEGKALANVLPAVTRLTTLLEKMQDLLSKPYAFTVFQEKSCNFGIMVTYRQAWKPEQYQVGDLVSTIPLAPRETRRYTTKQVTKRSRAHKEIANNLNAVKTEIDTIGRADRAIIDRAENRTNFKVSADGTFGIEVDKIHATAEGGGDSAKISETTKKDFREAVLRSAQEYKRENRMEVETSHSGETESTTYNEIQNPNDELTVTYLFYELQRTYRISEKIHQVAPVVLVANKVPAPHELDDSWLLKNDWILRRVLLDDSFRSALEYLTKSFVGDELNLQILDNNVKYQRQIVDRINAQVAAQISLVQGAQRDLNTKMDVKGGLEFTEGFLNTVKNVFDPFHLTGMSSTGTKEGADTIATYAQETLDRAEREKIRLLDQLGMATTALQTAVDKMAAATKEHYDKVAEIDRLRVHVKENILYYMQAIWNHEPPDQRYFRVFEIKVPVLEPDAQSINIAIQLAASAKALSEKFGIKIVEAQLPLPKFEIKSKPLVEIADLDNVLGYKGNYAIYRLKENNYLTLHMMQDYLQLSDELTIRDPDDFANYTIDQLQELASCLYKQDKTDDKSVYKKYKGEIKQWMIDRLTSGRPEDDRVIVPTKSLYIEALVGTHPLLEDFKLIHRALDVKKVQAEVRHAELENIRLAARALKGKDGDPDIDKVVVVEGGQNVTVDAG